MKRLAQGYHLWRHLGAGWLLFRLKLAASNRLHLEERKMPVGEWGGRGAAATLPDTSLADAAGYASWRRSKGGRFFFSGNDRQAYAPILAGFDHDRPGAGPIARAKDIQRGYFPFFEWQSRDMGMPPNWHVNPFTGQSTPSEKHWSRIGDFGSGDIKLIWELSRFSFVYPLVRAWFRTGDSTFAETFWQLIESWRKENPPNAGANWKCGQEASLRALAWSFGLHAFIDCPESTPERVAALGEMIGFTGSRVASHIDYALSQRNNHGISEAVGLFTIGALFPEFRDSRSWAETGRQHLERLGHELIYDDGSFSQHSGNYQRLMLHDYLWALRLGELNGLPFSSSLRNRVGIAGEFLHQIQDETTGRIPCFGQNDGALILPLNNCSSLDYRPIVQSIRFLSEKKRTFPRGPWDEDLLWMFGASALDAEVQIKPRENLAAEDGGCWTLRQKESFAFVRSPRFRDRPSQADLLHVDLWISGVNVALDAGTYSYNAPEPFNNSFARTIYHNTVSVDGADQMERVGRFLWLPWARGNGGFRNVGGRTLWEGEHDGYLGAHGVRHRRAILPLEDDSWAVIDRISAAHPHELHLHWLLPNLPNSWVDPGTLRLEMPDSSGLFITFGSNPTPVVKSIIADPKSARGWRSPTYFYKEPAISVEAIAESNFAWFWTIFSRDKTRAALTAESLVISRSRPIRIQLQSSTKQNIVAAIS